MGGAPQVAQWRAVFVQLLPPLGHTGHQGSKERVNQRYPLAMITYGLGILPLIQDLRTAHPRVTKPWYANDAGAGGNFAGICQNLYYWMVQVPPRGYFLETTKSILAVSPWNVPQADAFFRGYGLQVVTGS